MLLSFHAIASLTDSVPFEKLCMSDQGVPEGTYLMALFFSTITHPVGVLAHQILESTSFFEAPKYQFNERNNIFCDLHQRRWTRPPAFHQIKRVEISH